MTKEIDTILKEFQKELKVNDKNFQKLVDKQFFLCIISIS